MNIEEFYFDMMSNDGTHSLNSIKFQQRPILIKNKTAEFMLVYQQTKTKSTTV